MIGTFRMVGGGKLTFTEFFMLQKEADGGVVLKLKHFGPKLDGWEEKDKFVSFPLVRVEKNAAYFGGLTYAIQPDGSMKAWVAMKQKDGTFQEGALHFNEFAPVSNPYESLLSRQNKGLRDRQTCGDSLRSRISSITRVRLHHFAWLVQVVVNRAAWIHADSVVNRGEQLVRVEPGLQVATMRSYPTCRGRIRAWHRRRRQPPCSSTASGLDRRRCCCCRMC